MLPERPPVNRLAKVSPAKDERRVLPPALFSSDIVQVVLCSVLFCFVLCASLCVSDLLREREMRERERDIEIRRSMAVRRGVEWAQWLTAVRRGRGEDGL